MKTKDDRFEVIADEVEGHHHMKVYKLDKPRKFQDRYGNTATVDGLYASYVAAAMDTGEPETMVFPYDLSKDEVASWSELYYSPVDSVTDDSAVMAILDMGECV